MTIKKYEQDDHNNAAIFMSNKLSELTEGELANVVGGSWDPGTYYYIGIYICPHCNKQHEIRFGKEPGETAESVYPNNKLPCGKGDIHSVYFSLAGTGGLFVTMYKNGVYYKANITPVGYGFIGGEEVYI